MDASMPVDGPEWDERYSDGHETRMWSGRPNGTLVAEVTGLAPGTALEVGCGEGADAIWLARHGWQVTALDPSWVALDRARAAASADEVAVTWVHAGLLEVSGGTGRYDLVSAQYPALRHDGEDAALRALLAAVAPGGTLLVVHHVIDRAFAHEHGWDPDEFLSPHDVAARLDGEWVVEAMETRPRPGPLPEDAHHVEDVVLRARRQEPSARGHQPG